MNNRAEFHFSKPEESSGYLLWQITMLWQKKMNRSLSKIDITHTQFVIMAALAWLSGKETLVTQVDIANHSNTDRMMVSKILKTLISKKLIDRKEHPSDTRAKCITLTDKGLNLFKMAIKIVEEVDNSFFAILDEKQQSFNSNMQILMAESK